MSSLIRKRDGGVVAAMGAMRYLLLAVCLCWGGIAQAAAQIEVSGNGNPIPDGATPPSVTNHTDFGSALIAAGMVVRTFTITNNGDADLTLTGVTVDPAAGFTVTRQPAGTVSGTGGPAVAGARAAPRVAGNSTTFEITFDPGVASLHNATVKIANNVTAPADYTFDIRGLGTETSGAVGGTTLTVNGGTANDTIALSIFGGNLRVNDPNNGIVAGAGASQIDANTIEIDPATIDSIIINGGDGNDTLTIDFGGGNFGDTITFNGQGQSGTPGDTLVLQGGGPVAGVTHNFSNPSDGTVAVSGNGLITYTGLEPITDSTVAATKTFNFTGATETVTLSDDGTAGDDYSLIDSNLAESVQFLHPTATLTIQTTSDANADTIEIEGLDGNFDANLDITSKANDTVSFQANPTDLGSGNLRVPFPVVASTINISQSISTTGNLTFNNDVDLTGTPTLAGSAVNFTGTVDGAAALTVNASGATTFGDVVGGGTALTSLTTNAAGTTAINTTGITTSGAQAFNDPVTLGSHTVLTSTGAGISTAAITGGAFNLTVDADAAANITVASIDGSGNLTVTDSNNTTFGGTVSRATVTLVASSGTIAFQGNTSITTLDAQSNPYNISFTGANNTITNYEALNNTGSATFGNGGDTTTFTNGLSTTTNSLTNINGTLATTNTQLDLGPVSLGGATTINSGNGVINFNTINGGATLSVNSTGAVTFSQAVGGTTPLTSITTNTNGTTSLNGNVTTTGLQDFNDAVTLTNNVILQSNSNANISLDSTVNGAFSLSVNTTGDTTFGGAVGTLTAVTTNLGGNTNVDGGSITTSAGITLSDTVVMGDHTVLDGGTGAFSAISTGVITGTFNLTLDSGPAATISVNSITGGGDLTVRDSNGATFANAVTRNTVTITDTTDSQTVAFQGDTTIATGLITTSSNGYNVSFTGSTNSVAGDTNFRNTGSITLGNGAGDTITFAGGLATTGNVPTNPSGTNTAGSVLTTNTRMDLGTTTLTADTTIDTGTGGASVLNVGAVTGDFDLTLDSGPSANTSVASISGNGDLTLRDSANGFFGTLGRNTVTLTDTTGTVFFQGDTTIATGLTTANQPYNVSFTGANNNVAGDTTFANTGTVTLGNDAGDSISFDGGLDTAANPSGTNSAGSISSTDAQIDLGALTLTGNTTIDSGNADINLATINGGFAFVANSDDTTTFGGAVGGGTPLVSVTTDDGAGTDTTAINGGTITTTGAQTFNDAVTLGAGTTLTSSGSGNISFAQTVDNGQTLAINTAGTTTFDGVVGGGTPLTSVTTDDGAGADTTAINGGAISTTGGQTFNDAVTLGDDTTLTSSSSGDITFAQTVDNGQTLDVNTAGTTTFGGVVGGTALTSVTTDAPGDTAINGGAVTTTGAQAYNDPVTIGADTTLTSSGSGNVAFVSTLNGPQMMTINTGGTTSFGLAVGGVSALTSLTTNAAGTTALNGGSVTTNGAQTYGDPVTLGSDMTLSSITNLGITFGDTVNGGQALSVNTTGTTTFTGAVGGTTALSSVTTNAGGTAALDGGAATTTGDQIYNDSLSLGADTTLVGANLNFNAGVTGANDLTLQPTGTATFAASTTSDYTGTTSLDTGITRVLGTIDDSGGLVTVNSGSTLNGTGNVNRDVTVGNGGTVAPGTSPGVLNTGEVGGTVILDGGSTYRVDLSGATAGTNYDQLNVTGAVNINTAANLNLVGGYVAGPGAQHVVINNDAADAVTGNFNGMPEGASVAVGAFRGYITYVGGDGNDVVLVQGEPEMDVKGNGVSIADGDTTPDAADHTHFGTTDVGTGTIVRTFTIENTGPVILNLTGIPRVQVSGPHAADFIVTLQPSTPLVGDPPPPGAPGTALFQVSFTPGGFGDRDATITIANDDSNENPYNFDIRGTGTVDVSVTASPSSMNEDAAGTMDFTFTRTGSTANPLTVDFTVGGTAVFGVSPNDYTQTGAASFAPPNGTVTIPAGSSTAVVSINPEADAVVELDETVILTLAAATLPDEYNIVSPNSDTTTITNDDQANISINDVALNEADGGLTNFVFTVTLDSDVDNGVTVDFATANGTATTGDSDYAAVSGTGPSALTFAGTAGETESITVQVTGDTKVELDETFFVNLSNIQSALRNVVFSDNQGLGTIQNDDAVTLSIDDVTAAEGNAGTTSFNFMVSLSDTVDADVTVDVDTADVTATTGDSDYTAIVNGNATVTAGSTSTTVTVTVSGDTKVELDETFEVNLSNIAAGGRGVAFADTQGIGTIQNDDATVLSIGDVTLNEGNSGATNFNFPITLSSAVDVDVSIDFTAADDTATSADADYNAASGTVVILAGATMGTASVQVNGDTQIEQDEEFFVNLSNLVTNGRAVTNPDTQAKGTITNDDSATVSIDDVTMDEGDTGTTSFDFTLTISDAVDVDITVNHSSTAGTAALADGDYIALPASTVIPAGSTTATLTLTVNGDEKVELDETRLVDLDSLTTNGRSVTIDAGAAQGTATITNDDAATVTIDDVTQLEGDAGTTNFVFTVTLDRPVDVVVDMNYETADGTATTADSDYTQITTTALPSFPADASGTQTITVAVIGDDNVELDEIFYVNLSSLAAGGRSVTLEDDRGDGKIVNDEGSTITIDDVSIDEGNAGTTSFDFTVTFNTDAPGGATGSFTVDFATANDTATTADSDYASQTGTLNFAGTDGETQTISIAVTGDGKVELDETFFVDLSNIQAGGRDITFSDDQGLGTIQNDDQALISIDDPAIAEGDTGLTDLTFTVTLDTEVDTGVTVDWTTADNAATTADTDYEADSGTLAFVGTAGETQQITISVVGDEKVELDEIFNIDLSNIQASGRNVVFAAGGDQGDGTITNDDQAKISIDDISLNEGDAGTTDFVFTVLLDSDVDVGVNVDFDTSDVTAVSTLDEDYAAQTGSSLSFTGNKNETKTITIAVTGETKSELDETFDVILSNIQATTRNVVFEGLGATETGVGTILNDDTALISINDLSIAEGNSPPGTTAFTFTVTLDRPVDVAVDVDFDSADDTATTGDTDYTAVTGTLTFPANASGTLPITVLVNQDNKVELDETFDVVLSNIQATTRSVVLDDGSGRGTIVNDDSATLSINDVPQVETDAGTTNFVFTVTLNAAVDTGVSVDFATTGGAATTADSDFAAQTGTLNFAGTAGETETITVAVNGDQKVELDESFFVNLSNIGAAGRDVTFADNQGEGTIQNDDAALVTIDDVTQAETDTGATNFVFTVTLDTEVDTAVSIDFTTNDDTATTADSDYTAISGTGATALIFAGTAGETHTITVSVNGDEKVELDETFFVDLSNIVAGTRDVTFDDSQGLGTITNDDSGTLVIDDVILNEGDAGTTTYTFTVTLDADVDSAVSVDYDTADDSATLANNDYNVAGGTLNFAGTIGETETFTVQVNGDLVTELNETFLVNLTGLSAGGRDITIADSQGEGTIINDDAAKISIDDITLAEGDSGSTNFVFTVTLDTQVDTGLTVDFASDDDTATTGDSDYTAAVGSPLNFAGNAGETQTITVPVTGDTKVELDETFHVDLSNIQASGRDVTFSDNQGIGTITNDDAATLSIDDVTLAEGNAGNTAFTFTVTLSNEVDTSLSVDWVSADNTATTADSDYTNAGGTLNFLGTDTTKQFTINALGDVKVEAAETFFANLSNILANGRDVTFADNQGLGTINNDDTTAISINDFTITEGDSGSANANFTVTLTNPSDLTVTVDYATANNTATAGSDYTATSGTFTFAGEGTAGTISVPVLGDVLEEPNETFFLNLSNPTVATIADNQGVCTIVDNEEPPTIDSFTSDPAGNATVGEIITFTVGASDPNGDPLNVVVDYGDGSTGNGAVTTHAYSTSGTFTVTATVSDGKGGTDTATLTITTSAVLVGDGPDSDGDGFSDSFEALVGSDPDDINSTPFGSGPATPIQPLTVTTLAVKLKFNVTLRDGIICKFTLPRPADFAFRPDHPLTVGVGGVVRSFTLFANKKGTVAKGGGALNGAIMKNNFKKNIIFGLLKAKKQDLATIVLAATNLTNETVKGAARTVNVFVIFNETMFSADVPVIYTAVQDKKGTAKKPR